MTMMRATLPFALTAALCAGAVMTSQAQSTDSVTVPFSDPARPGTVTVSMPNGRIIVKGGNRKDVLVSSVAREEEPRRGRTRDSGAAAGLQRLTQRGGFEVTEANNQMTIDANQRNREVNVEIQVPTRVNLKLHGLNGGDILVDNVDGDLEVQHQNGSIRLVNVAGSVVANSQNGNVVVTMSRLTGDKAMAFTSFNGNVDLTMPATTKANLKMQSGNGDIFTDFDVQTRPGTPPQTSRRSDGRIRIEVNQAIYGAINGGGPEFELRTFNGNIYVRKAAQ
jgi:hypothetical protein